VLELDRGRDHRVVDDRVADDLAGSRATNDGGAFEMAAQLTQQFTRLDQRPSAKDEDDTLSFNFEVGLIRLPSITWRPLVLGRSHDLLPCCKTKRKKHRLLGELDRL
jgi:hypothetical protein